MTRVVALLAGALIVACGGAPEVGTPAPGAGDERPAAPWSAAALSASSVPSIFISEWNEAENREWCALIAPAAIDPADATARRANFSGGWAVAYDVPGLRSAFGVAGTGATVFGDVYDEWPHHLEWADGSRAGYGPEGGGASDNILAYLRIDGQQCLYNVWSRLGVEHLERLLGELRWVEP